MLDGMQQNPTQPISLARSLAQAGEESARRSVPLVVMISQTGCPFCRTLRKNVLLPWLASPTKRERLVFVEVSLDDGYELEDFNGERIAGRTFAERYETFVTPTVLVLDSTGKKLGAPIIGAPNLELYSYYFERAVTDAGRKLRAREVTD